MAEAFIYDHTRTPRGKGKKDGSLHEVTAIELAAQVLRRLKEKNDLPQGAVEDIYYGIVMPVGEQGQVLPRMAAMAAGYGDDTPAVQISRFCASGLESVNLAAAQVIAGQSELTIGGGVESMSRVPMQSDGGAWAVDPRIAIDQYFVPQGISADLIATKYGFSRDDLDAYSVESHKRAANSWAKGYFRDAVIPVKDINGLTILDHDETVRPNTDMQALGALKPSFAEMGKNFGFDSVAIQKYPDMERIDHVHHAGNSSGIVDGSGAVLVGSKRAGKKYGLTPRAKIRSFGNVGTEPTIMLTGPSFAAEKALKNAGMKKSDIDLWELNEAFAAVVLRFMQALDVPHDKINVNGGAIAMGHPLGATGAMILGTVVDELERRDLNTALITLCIGAGMGVATVIERV